MLVVVTMLIANLSNAQIQTAYKSWNPAKDATRTLAGQAWPTEVQDFYDRLPARAEPLVRKPVWNLSKNSSGLNLKFKSNATEIVVKYQVAGSVQMSHMPATGVSGVDLYANDGNGKWLWAAAQFKFGDTIAYRFNTKSAKQQELNYTLFLPLYNAVKWMEISVPTASTFTPIPVSTAKPIVIYGTSIAQGACASRPGMSWSNILSRRVNQPIINLAFSGNGRLEKEIIDLLTEIDAKLYVLDCLPNLTAPAFTEAEVQKRLEQAVTELQMKKPGVPILLTEHDGYTDEGVNIVRKETYESLNKVLVQTFSQLKAKGVKGIYLLTKKEINQDIDTMVDGTHPNDAGMLRYASAYENAIKTILKLK